MRYLYLYPIDGLNFRNSTHAHSHVAMLGWIYMGLYTFLIVTFLPKEKQDTSYYNQLFWLTEFSVVGMFIAFPIQGYAGWSIAFSTLHILCSYAFVYRFWKDLPTKKSPAQLFVKTALVSMVLATFAIWGMPYLMINGFKGTAIYHGAVQFYLHFQFNGWMIFALLALFFKSTEYKIYINRSWIKPFYTCLLIGLPLTYIGNILGPSPSTLLLFINGLGNVCQLFALFFFIKGVYPLWHKDRNQLTSLQQLLFSIATCSFILKIIIQAFTIIPIFAVLSFTIKNYLIGFLHLLLLGFLTTFLIGFALIKGWLSHQFNLRIGIALFITGIILSEGLLFLQGTFSALGIGMLPFYHLGLFLVSSLLPIGILFILTTMFRVSATQNKLIYSKSSLS